MSWQTLRRDLLRILGSVKDLTTRRVRRRTHEIQPSLGHKYYLWSSKGVLLVSGVISKVSGVTELTPLDKEGGELRRSSLIGDVDIMSYK